MYQSLATLHNVGILMLCCAIFQFVVLCLPTIAVMSAKMDIGFLGSIPFIGSFMHLLTRDVVIELNIDAWKACDHNNVCDCKCFPLL